MSETAQTTREDTALITLRARDRALSEEIAMLKGRLSEVQDLISLLEQSGRKRKPRAVGEAQTALPVGEC